MKTSPHIIKMKPYMVPKVWGGQRLETVFGKDFSGHDKYGESWEIADLDEGQSVVDSGPLAGLPLRALAEGWKRALVGRKAKRPDRFPLLVKLLDACRDLSVQVHPGPKDAEQIVGALSKEETWLMLDVEGGGEIIHGLTENGVSADDFRHAVSAGLVEELLQRVTVQAGDVVHVAPGTIHAIGAGVALLEIQEPSDTTYRVYDYDRPGLDGQPRQLHLEQAIAAASLRRSEQIIARPRPLSSDVEVVAEPSAYRVERLTLSEPGVVRWNVDPDSPQILHVLSGEMTVDDGIGDSIQLGPFESAVVPALMGSVKATVASKVELIVGGLAVESLVRGLRVDSVSAVTS